MRVTKEYKFESSHILPNHPGRCSQLHGHSYRCTVGVEGQPHKDSGFVIDYWDIDAVMNPIVERFDHQHLNHHITYPSAENIAAHIAHILRLPFARFKDFWVTVNETAKTSATWDSKDVIDRIRLDGRNSSVTGADTIDWDGWRSPNVPIPVDAADRERIEKLMVDQAKTFLSRYDECMTAVTQIRLFEQSLVQTEDPL